MKGTTTQSRTVLLPAAWLGCFMGNTSLSSCRVPPRVPPVPWPSPVQSTWWQCLSAANFTLTPPWGYSGRSRDQRGSEGPGPQLTALSRVLRQISNKIPQGQHLEPHRSELCKTMTTTTAMSSSGGGAGEGRSPEGTADRSAPPATPAQALARSPGSFTHASFREWKLAPMAPPLTHHGPPIHSRDHPRLPAGPPALSPPC